MKKLTSKTLVAVALAPLLLGSPGVNAEPTDADAATAAPQQETRDQADKAHREAVSDALLRISASTRLDLEVELPARSAQPMSGD